MYSNNTVTQTPVHATTLKFSRCFKCTIRKVDRALKNLLPLTKFFDLQFLSRYLFSKPFQIKSSVAKTGNKYAPFSITAKLSNVTHFPIPQ